MVLQLITYHEAEGTLAIGRLGELNIKKSISYN
jgi:hypothetical protein